MDGRLVQLVVNTLSWTKMSHDWNRIQKDFIIMGDGAKSHKMAFSSGGTPSAAGVPAEDRDGEASEGGRGGGWALGLYFISSSI